MFRFSSDREGSAHVWDGCRSAGLHPESRGGMHLHRRKRQREEPIRVHGGICHITSGTFLQNTAEPL